jgi:uncharacterized protein YjbI with pentapeptide repeats
LPDQSGSVGQGGYPSVGSRPQITPNVKVGGSSARPAPPPGGFVSAADPASAPATALAASPTRVSTSPNAALARCAHTYQGCNLSGADLADVNLQGAKLQGANLQNADLAGANLAGADLAGANLQDASLSGADLAGADLAGANVQGADLAGADLNGANLKGANLKGISWSHTTCPGGTDSDNDAGTCERHP